MAEQTRPSAVVQRPDPDRAVSDCTVAELLFEVKGRAEGRRAALAPADFPPEYVGIIAREYALAITHVEDATTRFNKGVYMERGIFAITDAERTV